jgi:hypothetical protein
LIAFLLEVNKLLPEGVTLREVSDLENILFAR